MVRRYPIQLPIQPPQEAYINPDTFDGSITSSRNYWERTKGIDGKWGALNKSQNAVLTKIRCLTEELDKMQTKTGDVESMAFCEDLSNYLVSIMPMIASFRPAPVIYVQPTLPTLLGNENSITKHLLK